MKKLGLIGVFLLVLSCHTEERIDLKKLLTANEWEQMTGIVDGSYTVLKMFYRISFRNDSYVEIEMDYGNVSGDPDPIILNKSVTRYELDISTNTISFPDNLDTLLARDENGTISMQFVRLNKMRLVATKPEQLNVEFVESGFTGMVFGFGKAYFQPRKNK